jgi:hypothetical protein
VVERPLRETNVVERRRADEPRMVDQRHLCAWRLGD